MTDQELFDRVAEHLLRQNAQSYDEVGECMYRGQDGLKCAVGCLIPDSHYSGDLESWPAWDLNNDKATSVTRVLERLGISPLLAAQLQLIHDRKDPPEWPTALREFASARNLDDSVIDRVLKELGR